jgi:hypothetical protein
MYTIPFRFNKGLARAQETTDEVILIR